MRESADAGSDETVQEGDSNASAGGRLEGEPEQAAPAGAAPVDTDAAPVDTAPADAAPASSTERQQQRSLNLFEDAANAESRLRQQVLPESR